ncbi:MAG: pyruvate kinase [Candidatus Omnitrophica bacterium]|nr:pyruvate kinase [Candidatus Omnitrophota bacterium]
MRQYWNKTKVICTIGPASNSTGMLKKMILAGMDIARFNFSHGRPQDQSVRIQMVKSLAKQLGSTVGVLQDLPGPKIRIGELKSGFIELKKGQKIFLTGKSIIGDTRGISINNRPIIRQLKKNDVVYLNDGLVKLVVTQICPDKVFCEIIIPGRIYPRKGVSCPGKVLETDVVTAYDLNCLRYGIKAGIDFVAVSFVQCANDIKKVKRFLEKQKAEHIFVVAKIERKIAFERIDEIIQASDAVMVARGDLGIEADLEDVPFLQKEIIKKCNQAGRPVITATQMLESMVNSPLPTRAEVTDIANAILDGTDLLMLSEETAVGDFPLKALETMVRIAAKAESRMRAFVNSPEHLNIRHDNEKLTESLSRSAVETARSVKAKAVMVPTLNANSISWLSRLRPDCTIVGITSDPKVYTKLILFWGVYPILIKAFADLGTTLKESVRLLKIHKLAKLNDKVVFMLTDDNNLFLSNIIEVRVL